MFYKEDNFRNSEIGKVPKDWELKSLSQLAEYINGYAFKPSEWKKSGLPIIRIQNLNNNLAEYNYFDGDIDKRYIVNQGDLLLSWSGTLGIFTWNGPKALLNQHIFKVIPNKECSKTFFYYVAHKAIGQLKTRVHGSTMKHFQRKELNYVMVATPSIIEQQKITNVLSNIDIAIQKTDELIAETDRLKKGLLEQLFTKGLNHKRFKKTEIRTRIYNLPEEWRISNLSETSTIKGRIGWQGLTTKEYLKEGKYLLVTGTDFEKGRIVWDRCVYVSEERYMQDTNIQLKEGDILITKDGTIGKIAYVDKLPQQATLNSGIFVVRPVNSAYDPSYMFWIMQSKFFNVFMNILKAGSTISHLYQRDFVNFEFPIPSFEEQQKIVKILSTVDHKLDLERKEKRHLERVKSGLMNKLLSGRVRVK